MSLLNLKMVMFLGCFVSSSCMAVDGGTYSPTSAQQLQNLINERSSTAESAIDRYQLAKANAWLSYANHEHSERGITSAGKEAFAQADRLFHQKNTDLVTQIISPSQVMRRDLWWQIEYLKQRGALDVEPRALANAEVLLVWAAAEYCELGWRHAREHFISAERQLQKVIYALSQEENYLQATEAHLPELSELNGRGCQGVNSELWPLKVPQKSFEPVTNLDTKTILKVENVVHFALDQSKLNQQGKSVLDRIVELMREYPDLNITLMGYTDIRASVQYNLALSQRRIDAVRGYLQQNGIEKNRIAEQVKGKVELIGDEQELIGHAKSRRVVIHFQDGDARYFDIQPQWRDLQLENH